MGTVLFLIYLADIVGSLQFTLGCVTGVLFGICFIALVLVPTYESEREEAWAKIRPRLWIPIVTGTLALLMPSQQLLYIAAALKTGQEVVETPLVQKAYKAMDTYLDSLIGTTTKQ